MASCLFKTVTPGVPFKVQYRDDFNGNNCCGPVCRRVSVTYAVAGLELEYANVGHELPS